MTEYTFESHRLFDAKVMVLLLDFGGAAGSSAGNDVNDYKQ
jgi:hypothetical protein